MILSGILAFTQEYRAERAAERLCELLSRAVTVVRVGVHHGVPAEQLCHKAWRARRWARS